MRTCCCFGCAQTAVEDPGRGTNRGELRRPLRGLGGDVRMKFCISARRLAACQSVHGRYRGEGDEG